MPAPQKNITRARHERFRSAAPSTTSSGLEDGCERSSPSRIVMPGRAGSGGSVGYVPIRLSESSGGIELTFHLLRSGGRLHVERAEFRSSCGLSSVDTMSFDRPESFDRWLRGEWLRFSHPLLYAKLNRIGHDLFDSRE